MLKCCRQIGLWGCVVVLLCCFSAFTPNTTPNTSNTRRLPILMYHKIAPYHAAQYVVTTDQLAADWQAITAAGYTPVFLSEVIAWVEGHGDLPAKPIVITFDDGQYNNVYYGLPLARQYGVKYMINPVTAYSAKSMHDQDTENPRYSNLSWTAIKAAYDSGYVEFGNHSHNLHQTSPRFGVAAKRGEDPAAYEQLLIDDLQQAQTLLTNCGIPAPTTFAYPFGKYTTRARQILLNFGFKALLTCNEHVNTIVQGDPTTLQALGRFNRSGKLTTAQIMRKINQ